MWPKSGEGVVLVVKIVRERLIDQRRKTENKTSIWVKNVPPILVVKIVRERLIGQRKENWNKNLQNMLLANWDCFLWSEVKRDLNILHFSTFAKVVHVAKHRPLWLWAQQWWAATEIWTHAQSDGTENWIIMQNSKRILIWNVKESNYEAHKLSIYAISEHYLTFTLEVFTNIFYIYKYLSALQWCNIWWDIKYWFTVPQFYL